MEDNEKMRKIAELLRQLAEEGATISNQDRGGSKLSTQALTDVEKQEDFQAWVSWNKSF